MPSTETYDFQNDELFDVFTDYCRMNLYMPPRYDNILITTLKKLFNCWSSGRNRFSGNFKFRTDRGKNIVQSNSVDRNLFQFVLFSG